MWPLLALALAASAAPSSDPALPGRTRPPVEATSAAAEAHPAAVPPADARKPAGAEEPAAASAAPRAGAPAQPAASPTAGEDLSPPTGPSPRLGSIQGGEPLGSGGTIISFTGGYTTLSAAFAQGLSAGSDYGAVLELDWRTSELVAAGMWRQALWRSGPFLLAWRVRGGPYADLGTTWSITSNRSDGGFQVQPGLAGSARLGGYLLSLAVDAPVNITFSRGGGLAAGLRGAAGFEAAIQRDVAVGLRVGGGALWSSGGAPFSDESPLALVDISVMLTYQFL